MPKTLLFIVGGVVAAVVILGALYMFVLGGGKKSADAQPAASPTPVSVPGKIGPRIEIAERVYVLKSPADKPRYAKVDVIVEFETTDPEWAKVMRGCVFAPPTPSPCQVKEDDLLHKFAEEIGSGQILVQDAVTRIMSSHTAEEMNTAEGREKLRAEIKSAVAELIYEPHVSRVLFPSFITQ